jgi:hypothetical protein
MPKRILIFLAVFFLVIGWTILAPFVDRADMESKSVNTMLSVSPVGYKALYLLMGQLQQKPVTLWQHSMMKLPLDEPKTVWFIEPGPGLFFDGESYTHQMQALVDRGYHFVFVLNTNAQSLTVSADQKEPATTQQSVLDYLNGWYNLGLETESLGLGEEQTLSTTSSFPSRPITTLYFQQPEEQLKTWKKMGIPLQNPGKTDTLMRFHTFGYGTVKPLLKMQDGMPLALQFQRGQGTITIILNSFFFQNAQLDKYDNAALAAAVQEQFPNAPILFEVYSSGFSENKDIITYLASGKGVVFLISMVMLFAGFCLWLANRPVRRVHTSPISNERYFTQEAFIDALSQHYLSTGRWHDLYRKLLSHFTTQLEQLYPGLSEEERLRTIAQNPFLEVSLKELEGIFTLKQITSEAAFLEKSQVLLEVQRKVCRYEHNRANSRAYSPAKIRR